MPRGGTRTCRAGHVAPARGSRRPSRSSLTSAACSAGRVLSSATYGSVTPPRRTIPASRTSSVRRARCAHLRPESRGQGLGCAAGAPRPRSGRTSPAGVPEGATAAIVNVTMTGATTVGNLRVYPAGEDLPNASTVNFAPGREKANGTVVELSADGELAFYSDSPVSAATSPVQVVIDVVGYVTVGSDLAGSVPTRMVDTRAGDGPVSY